MVIFNLTDVPTSALKARGLVNSPIKIEGKVIQPGAYETVERLNAEHYPLVGVGAIALNKLPDTYAKAKAAMLAAKTPKETTDGRHRVRARPRR